MTLALPPYGEWLGLRVTQEGDELLFVLPFAETVIGRPRFVHGGALGGLLEIAAVGTLRAALAGETPPPRVRPVTVTFDFMRGGRERETFATARVNRLGARIANVEAFAWQDDRDRPIAAARMTLTIDR